MSDWQYRFEFEGDHPAITVEASWDAQGILQAGPGADTLPEPLAQSVRLDVDPCSHCPLRVEDSPLCPLAASVIPVTQLFDAHSSTDAVAVIATSAAREVRTRTTLQRGLGSLLGLLMGGSACPHFATFRPMATMHLPFATEEETFFRVIGNSLLELALRGGRIDLDQACEHLRQQYQALSVVNLGMARRLRRGARNDSGVNAVIVLDMLARLIGGDPDEYVATLRALYPDSPAA